MTMCIEGMLGAPDSRLAAAKLSYLGFVPTPAKLSPVTSGQLDIVAAWHGLTVGSGWYPFERWGGQTFRWVNNDAEIIIGRPAVAPCTLSVDVEPAPGVGSGPFTLLVYDSTGSIVTSSQVTGRDTLRISGASALGQTSLRLHVEGGGKAAPGDPRILNFRVFSAECLEDFAGSRSLLLQFNADPDIAPATYRQALSRGESPADGIVLGRGWYDVESAAGERFRWVSNDAELVATSPTRYERSLDLDIEPGPGVGSQSFVLRILDAEGNVVATMPVNGRELVHATLPTQPGPSSLFRLLIDSGGQSVPDDARILNFRVFSVR